MQTCKHCRKSFLKNALKSHLESCPAGKTKKKKEPQPKEKTKVGQDKEKDKEKGVAKPKEKKIVVGDEDGEGEDDDDAEGDEEQPKKSLGSLAGGLKAAKKSAGKKTDAAADGEKKSKKRKADGDAEKGPKPKKKKEEPKPKAPKPKGEILRTCAGNECAQLCRLTFDSLQVQLMSRDNAVLSHLTEFPVLGP